MPTGTPKVILVVEDEWFLRDAIARALRHAGWEVFESRTAEAAIAYLRAGFDIDVIFTDIQLAGRLSGWDVADRFRVNRADAPVIYTSGNAADRSRSVLGSLFFDKPYDTAEVVRACHSFGPTR